MAFNSSLLKATDSGSAGIELQSVVKNIDTRPPIYNFLEFNSDIQDIDLGSKIAQYRLLVEGVYLEDNNQSLAVVNEGLVKNIFEGLIKIIRKIIKFFKDIGTKAINMLRKQSAPAPANNPDIMSKRIKVKMFHYPDLKKVDNGEYRSYLGKMVTILDQLVNGAADDPGIGEAHTRVAFKNLCSLIKKSAGSSGATKLGDVTDIATFNDFINKQICYVTDEEMTYRDWYNAVNSRVQCTNEYVRKCSELVAMANDDLNKSEAVLSRAESHPDIYNQDHIQKIRIAVSRIKEISNAYAIFIYTTSKFHNMELEYFNKIVRSVNKTHKVEDSYDESALFHGEPFNSDTLFDNEDMRDFNRTEWMDLNLTVECYEMKYALTKSMQDLIVNEALILTDNKPNKIARLKALREAEEKKSGGKIATLIDNIRKILQKFISALTSKFNNLAGYIRKYKGQIDKPITFTSNMKSNGDILAGMYRVQGGINIIPFDYNSMKDDLKDKKTFFAKRILPSMNKTVQSSKRNVKWTDDMEIATYCKIYFGASMPQDKYPMCEFTASEMDNNKGNIIRYLTEKNMAFSAKTDLAKLEAESKKINVSAAAKAAAKSSDNKDTNNSTSNATTAPASDNDSKNESMYYSELYQRWITEADIDMGNVAQNTGDTSSANADNEIFKAFRVYMDTYKDVIFAKMTGAEFVFSELKQLIVMHAVKNGAPKPGPDPVQPQGPAAKN